MKRTIFALCFLSVSASFLHSEVTLFRKPTNIGLWASDSLFVGADIIVKDSMVPVTIAWTNSKYTALKGKLWLIRKGMVDSAAFLFHNLHPEFAGEPSIINIGKFPNGTKLQFFYEIIDSVSPKFYYKKKLFSGQNIVGKDSFISERKGIYDFRHSIVGKIDENTVELCFDDQGDFIFTAIMIKISNASILKE